MEYLAHSAKENSPPQSYASHIDGVLHRASRFADKAAKYAVKCKEKLKDIVLRSAFWHDLGKLNDENQAALHDSENNNRRHLPWNHVDAGSAALKESSSYYSALLVYSHHRGLPDSASENIKCDNAFRDDQVAVRSHTDSEIQELIERQTAILKTDDRKREETFDCDLPVFFRMALSCLADADHTDTATAYGQAPEIEELPQLRAEERLNLLDKYVLSLGKKDERSRLREDMYYACRDAKTKGSFTACDSPVGTGKTTAIMAHLLKQAIARNARRVFVILPYTSIIRQSVDVYRRALVLPGEDPEQVVAELHYQADFQDKGTRYLTSLWRAPVIVTTAVAFFETLASNRPAALRPLHELPGSVVFLDEAHNALPLTLLPLAWHWMNILAEEWSCYWVLASGSLVRYWLLDSLAPVKMKQPYVAELVDTGLRERLMQYEQQRVEFRWRPKPIGRKQLIEWVHSVPGPRLLILNTVQSAAVIANDFSQAYGRNCVEHLSTALTADDRKKTIERVKARLENKEDTEWTLVATSCVEAGVDFSFRNGFRELSSLFSLLQVSGRANRNGLFNEAFIWSFVMQDDAMLTRNPMLDASREVLKNYLNKDINIGPELSTRSMNDEIILNDSCISTIRSMMLKEEDMSFKTVNDRFNVIESNTVPAVVDAGFADIIRNGGGSWQMLQNKAVSVRCSKIKDWRLREIADGVYQWTLGYDPFIGYMRGVLDGHKY